MDSLPRGLTINSTATVTSSNLQGYKTAWLRSKVDAIRDDSRWSGHLQKGEGTGSAYGDRTRAPALRGLCPNH